MNSIQSTFLSVLPASKKKTPSGWISFNAPCCVHYGESQDKRKRGGVMSSPDGGFSYHCFNCGFKTTFVPGRKLSVKLRQLLGWLGVSDTEIKKLSLEALRLENDNTQASNKPVAQFKLKSLPRNSHALEYWLEKYIKQDLTEPQYQKIDSVLNYLGNRNISPDWYNFHYTPLKEWDLDKRIVIPFYWRGDVVGFTGRMVEKTDKVKYYTDVQPGYVFNIDNQYWDRKFVIVCEGVFDAIALDGVAVLGAEISTLQREIIDGLQRQVIVVPDRDETGEKIIDQALEFGWHVAFPQWEDDVKDIADAVAKYGRLFTLQSILNTVEKTNLKIKLKRKLNG